MNIILFDDANRNHLLPLTYTRPIADLRIGILTIREKWEKYLGQAASVLTGAMYLREKFPVESGDDNLLINGTVCPTPGLLDELKKLAVGQELMKGDVFVGARVSAEQLKPKLSNDSPLEPFGLDAVETETEFLQVARPWDIFSKNGEALKADFELITNGRQSQPLSDSNTVIGDASQIFLEEGAKAEAATFNTNSGPIYIGKNAEVMEGCIIRGPFALCESGVLKLAAKIYGPTTVGPHSKVGGEVNNSVITGYSNKGHDGFLGNSVLGEWCNLGADTNNSNLKNNYTEVRIWNYETGRFAHTGLTFCGLIMGDHSKCGINTMFNTGTVVGVFANIFGGGFPRNFIPSFSWGGAAGMTEYRVTKTFEVAERVMERRGIELTEPDKAILTHIYDNTSQYRNG